VKVEVNVDEESEIDEVEVEVEVEATEVEVAVAVADGISSALLVPDPVTDAVSVGTCPNVAKVSEAVDDVVVDEVVL
jgi:hypothetical protein